MGDRSLRLRCKRRRSCLLKTLYQFLSRVCKEKDHARLYEVWASI